MNLKNSGGKRFRYTAFLGCFLSAFIAVTVCSKSSFLYPFNDWVDANCFFTVGKSIRTGMVPYRDLFEQKGPLLYFVYALASLVSWDTFLGVYLIEILSGTAFLYFGWKVMELYCGRKAVYCVPFLALSAYACLAFSQGGSAEELCFPLLTASLWMFLKAERAQAAPSAKESFAIGLCAACVFWSKFTMVGLYPGWFVFFAVASLRRKQGKALLKTVLWIMLGLLAGTLPYVVYFGLNHAIGDWLEVYLYDNVMVYSKVAIGHGTIGFGDMWLNLVRGLENLAENNLPAVLLLAAAYTCGVAARRWRTLLCAACMGLGAYALCYVGGRAYTYYPLLFVPFTCLGWAAVCRLIAQRHEKKPFLKRWMCAGYAAVIALMVFLTPNRYLIGADRKEMPQYRFAEIISETPDAMLLNYNFLDGGFYTVTGIVPNCRAFCGLNIPLPELRGQQIDYLHDGVCDYVVTRNEDLKRKDMKHYTLVCSMEYELEGEMRQYRLYKRKDNAE